jgi:predicted RNA-binding Zn ribbon-like protein
MVRPSGHRSVRHSWGEADFVGGHPVLDFLNTVADTGKTRNIDKIPDWPAVRAWASLAGLLSDTERKRFLGNQSLDGHRELAELHRFREDAYMAMLRVVDDEASGSAALGRVHDRIRAALGRGRLERRGLHFKWRASPDTRRCWNDAVALAYEEFLRSDDLARVRQCARCTWFFVDRGRGVGRRWCDMRTCGNRAKMAAFRRP